MSKTLNETSVRCVLNLLMSVFDNDVATLDKDVIEENVELLHHDNMPIEYRAMPKDVFDFMLDNFGYIYALLIMDTDYRDMVLDYYITTVMEFKDHIDRKDINECVVFDMTNYNADFVNDCNKRLLSSFESLSEYALELNSSVADLTDTDKMVIGCIVSNFACYIKAHCINPDFANFTKHRVTRLENKLFINREKAEAARAFAEYEELEELFERNEDS